jgi:hypothetical protein
LNAVRAGGSGHWRKAVQTGENWIGHPVGDALGLNPADKNHRPKIKETVENWLKSGVLREVPSKDEHRNRVTYIEAGKPSSTEGDYDFG